MRRKGHCLPFSLQLILRLRKSALSSWEDTSTRDYMQRRSQSDEELVTRGKILTMWMFWWAPSKFCNSLAQILNDVVVMSSNHTDDASWSKLRLSCSADTSTVGSDWNLPYHERRKVIKLSLTYTCFWKPLNKMTKDRTFINVFVIGPRTIQCKLICHDKLKGGLSPGSLTGSISWACLLRGMSWFPVPAGAALRVLRGNFRNGDSGNGYGNGNATSQRYHWLGSEK